VTIGLKYESLVFLAENIAQNVEKLNLSASPYGNGHDDHVQVLLSRCNNIKALSLEPSLISDDSLKHIRQHMNLTLEELNLGCTVHNPINDISFTGLLQLKSMQRLQILNLYYEKDDSDEIQNLRQHLPQLKIKGLLN
jgi:hypothetical protein